MPQAKPLNQGSYCTKRAPTAAAPLRVPPYGLASRLDHLLPLAGMRPQGVAAPTALTFVADRKA